MYKFVWSRLMQQVYINRYSLFRLNRNIKSMCFWAFRLGKCILRCAHIRQKLLSEHWWSLSFFFTLAAISRFDQRVKKVYKYNLVQSCTIDLPFSPPCVSFFKMKRKKKKKKTTYTTFTYVSYFYFSADLVTVCGITVKDFGIFGKIGIGLLVDVGLVVTWIDLGRLRLWSIFWPVVRLFSFVQVAERVMSHISGSKSPRLWRFNISCCIRKCLWNCWLWPGMAICVFWYCDLKLPLVGDPLFVPATDLSLNFCRLNVCIRFMSDSHNWNTLPLA